MVVSKVACWVVNLADPSDETLVEMTVDVTAVSTVVLTEPPWAALMVAAWAGMKVDLLAAERAEW
jgi:hypothetical protein